MNNTGHYNTGHYNSGDYNSGYRNSGDCNSGDYNSGDYNSGDYNSGYYNSGYFNSGHSNSGDWNSGDWNSGNWNKSNYNNGHFNTKEVETIMVFNKPCSKEEWDNAKKPSFLFFKLTEYKDGELITKDYKEAFQESYNKASQEDKDLLLKLPNFDADVFEEISGIKVNNPSCSGKVVEIDGKKYKLTEI